MFLISTIGVGDPCPRACRCAGSRWHRPAGCPSCMLQSDTPRYVSSSFSSVRYALASSGERMSGWLTISNSGVPVRFRSIRLSALPATSSCMLLPASSSRWARMMPIFFGSKRPFGSLISKLAVVRERQIELADLIALGQVGIVILLAVPLRERGDLAVRAQRPSAGPARTPRDSSPAACRACRCRPGKSACSAARRISCCSRRTACSAVSKLHVNFQADDDGVRFRHVDLSWSQRRSVACASRSLVETCGRRAADGLLPTAGLAVAGRSAARSC